jgi:hypothetical protein
MLGRDDAHGTSPGEQLACQRERSRMLRKSLAKSVRYWIFGGRRQAPARHKLPEPMPGRQETPRVGNSR